jgi:hypothetical protein
MAVGALTNASPWEDNTIAKTRGRYFGRYLGFVRDRNDPSLLGRVRAHVPAITADDNNEENWLDWCVPASPGLIVPPVGAPIFVEFEHGVVTHGVYTWGWVLGSDATTSAAPVAGKGVAADPTWVKKEVFTSAGANQQVITHTLTEDPAVDQLPVYPFNKVFQSESGFVIEVDDSPAQPRMRIYHPAGATFLIDENGSMHIRTVGAIFQESGGDHVVTLKPVATFKVIYPGGGALVVGAFGVHAVGFQSTTLGRDVMRIGDKQI